MLRGMASQRKMKKLRDYLNSLSTADQMAFAERCDTSVGFLRKAISIDQELNAETVIAIHLESNGAVQCEDLRPDVKWQVFRNTA